MDHPGECPLLAAGSTGRCNIQSLTTRGMLTMKQRPRIYYTEEQKAMMWDRWQQGESLNTIAKLFDRYHSSISRIFAESGGIRPEPRRRSRLALTSAEREEISRGLVAGDSLRFIAYKLKRSPSTISREVARNGGRQRYRAHRADRSGANWPPTQRCVPRWRTSWRCGGTTGLG